MESTLLRNCVIAGVGLVGLVVGFVGGYLVPKDGGPDLANPDSARKIAAAATASKEVSTTTPGQKATAVSAAPLTVSQRAHAAMQVYKSRTQTANSAESGGAPVNPVEAMSLDEIPLFVEGLCEANSGPEGMDSDKRWMVFEALQKWWQSDKQAVLTWLNGLPIGLAKRFLSSMVLESMLYETDPALAMRMAKDFKARDPEWDMDGFQKKVVSVAIDKAWKNPASSAEQMLELYSQLPADAKRTTATNIRDYPENFDFRKFLDGLFQLVEQDKKPSELPGDALTAWARIDPQAAAAWLMETSEKSSKHFPFQEWNNISKAVADTHGTQAYYDWAANVLSGASDKFLKEKFRPEGSELLGIAGAMQNPAARDRVLSRGLSGTDIESTLRYLGMMSSPDSRLRAISENSYHFQEANARFQIDDSVYQELGLTREQVEDAITGLPRMMLPGGE